VDHFLSFLITFALAIVLHVLRSFVSDYTFGVFKLLFMLTEDGLNVIKEI
jgi:uncharacterized protein YggT (Ycf19 family)